METQLNIQKNLRLFTGSTQYYSHRFINVNLMLTDGAAYVRETCECYWLFDLIAMQCQLNTTYTTFTAVLRYRQAEENWLFTCQDQFLGDVFYKQVIPFSDFPLDEITLWVESAVCLLPSEH